MRSTIRQIGNQLSRRWQGQAPVAAVRALGAASRPLLRDGLAELLARVGATVPSRFARGALTIVRFRRVLPAEALRSYPLGSQVLTPEQLTLVLAELAPHFECSSVIDAYRRWRRPGPAAARPPLGISFDGGSLDHYEHARRVLDELSLRATFYVPVGNVQRRVSHWEDRLSFALLRSVAAARRLSDVDFDRWLAPFGLRVRSYEAILPDDALRLAAEGVAASQALPPERRGAALAALEAALGGDQVPEFAGMMSWEHVRELHQEGHEIGSQSLTLPSLSGLSDEVLREEVEGSRRALSERLGAPVPSFCYPDGAADARVVGAVRAAGYDCAVTTRPGLARQPAAFELPRFDTEFARLCGRHGQFSQQRLWLRLSGMQPGLAARGP